MTINARFLLLRLRNASSSEIITRLWQYLFRLHFLLTGAGGRPRFAAFKTAKQNIANLALPEVQRDCSFSQSGQINVEYCPPLIDYCPGAKDDVRLIWEQARLQQPLLKIIDTCRHPEDPSSIKNRQAAISEICEWISANPFPLGLHYQSAMECALRIPVFFTALKQKELSSNDFANIVESTYLHARLVSKKLSLYSSKGNHTVAEAAGLIVAGAIFRNSDRGLKWLKTGIDLLSEELPHQVDDDGGPAEQSLSYHRFVLDLFWMVSDFIVKNNLGRVDAWKPRLETGEAFLKTFKDKNGVFLTTFGDSDDGYAVAPGISPVRSIGKAFSRNPITFESSGYSVLRNDELFFTFDHGPLGMAPFYNHGHADALSITLAKNSRALLVDSGTYRYNGAPLWRKYFKGTCAHNTVTIDNQDQAVQETSFIWSEPYRTTLRAVEIDGENLFYKACHDGYKRLRSPVLHERSVFFFEKANFLVRDRFIGSGIHDFQINFHLHPNTVIYEAGKWRVIEHDGERIFIRLIEGEFQLVRGRTNPLMGWYSHRYGQKEPTSTLTFTRTGDTESVVFTTLICTRSALGDNAIYDKAGKIETKT